MLDISVIRVPYVDFQTEYLCRPKGRVLLQVQPKVEALCGRRVNASLR
jgi:hypothetical protein